MRAKEASMDAPGLACLTPRWLAAVYPICSHDLPNHLVALHSLLHLVDLDCAGHLTEDGKEYVKRLHGVADKIGELSDFLKEMVRLTRMDPARERVPLAAIVRELKARAAADALPIVAWEVDGSPEPMVGDARLLVLTLGGLLPLLLEAAGRGDSVAHLAVRRGEEGVALELWLHRAGAGVLSAAAQKGAAFALAASRVAVLGGDVQVLPAEQGRVGVALVLPATAS
jgi:hypothetical protein